MENKSASIRREAFQCIFSVISFEDYNTTKFLVEANVLKYAVDELRNGDSLVFDTAIEAANLIFWILMNGKWRVLKREEIYTDELNDKEPENLFLKIFEEIGGADVVEELTMHPNQLIKDIWNQIMNTFYRGSDENNSTEFNNENDNINNNEFGWAEYIIPDTSRETTNLLRF